MALRPIYFRTGFLDDIGSSRQCYVLDVLPGRAADDPASLVGELFCDGTA